MEHFSPSSKNLKNPPRENFIYEKISYTLILKSFLYFLKRKLFLYFRKPPPPPPPLKKKFLYLGSNYSSSKNEKIPPLKSSL